MDALLRGISTPVLHLPSYTQKTRSVVLRILQQFTLQKQLLLNQLSHPISFVTNVLAAIEGEKDPRNLLVCFDLTYFMLITFMNPTSAFYQEQSKEVLEQLEESFFDEIACYFPINFKPPKNDAHKITPEQLQSLLAKCMLASPSMNQHIVPYLLEKVSATQMVTKVASLHMLTQVAQKFSLQELIDPTTGG